MTVSELSSWPEPIPAIVDGLPNICGWEDTVQAVQRSRDDATLPSLDLSGDQLQAGFAIALHMHQPTLPMSPGGRLINNLQYMFEHPYEADNHNAGAYVYCYTRLADFIPELVNQGHRPRIMLDYSGNLLWGLGQMGRGENLEKLKRLTTDPAYMPCVEWLGSLWSHAIATQIPVADFPLQIKAWQHHFAAIFGWEALQRVRGFVAPELQLPNHPDVLFALVDTLLDCGYEWMLVPEHFLETPEGQAIAQPHVPHRLVVRNTVGECRTITVLIKTQGTDHRLVGQMQPYTVAKTLAPVSLGDRAIPPLVTQIADGENSGTMMNEFPGAFRRTWQDITQAGGVEAQVVGLNGTEYLRLMAQLGITAAQFPTGQAIGQQRLWQVLAQRKEPLTPAATAAAIATLTTADPNFRMVGIPAPTAGGTATHRPDREPSAAPRSRQQSEREIEGEAAVRMLSYQFHQIMQSPEIKANLSPSTPALPLTQQPRYRQALLHHLLLQTSCFRAWQTEPWVNYARDLHQRAIAILSQKF